VRGVGVADAGFAGVAVAAVDAAGVRAGVRRAPSLTNCGANRATNPPRGASSTVIVSRFVNRSLFDAN
jgi:hypothetical protein